MSLSGKVALVTGASRGIGRAILNRLAAEGALVIGTATSLEGADNITASLAEQNLKGHGYVLDVTDQSSINTMLADVQLGYGAPAILINNAGITLDNLLLRLKEEDWTQVIDTNLNSAYKMSKACLKNMLKARWGRIISISSIAAVSGSVGQTNYAAAKAGLIGFSKSLAQEVASREITVNVVAPGLIDTDMTRILPEAQREAMLQRVPMNRMGSPEDIAAAVAFLCSEHASYITGETLHINGGMYMA
jgi:3-oxoacyl-[acyl-carrier protein] reductase